MGGIAKNCVVKNIGRILKKKTNFDWEKKLSGKIFGQKYEIFSGGLPGKLVQNLENCAELRIA